MIRELSPAQVTAAPALADHLYLQVPQALLQYQWRQQAVGSVGGRTTAATGHQSIDGSPTGIFQRV